MKDSYNKKIRYRQAIKEYKKQTSKQTSKQTMNKINDIMSMKNVIKEELKDYHFWDIIIIISDYDNDMIYEFNDEIDYDYDDDYMNI